MNFHEQIVIQFYSCLSNLFFIFGGGISILFGYDAVYIAESQLWSIYSAGILAWQKISRPTVKAQPIIWLLVNFIPYIFRNLRLELMYISNLFHVYSSRINVWIAKNFRGIQLVLFNLVIQFCLPQPLQSLTFLA